MKPEKKINFILGIILIIGGLIALIITKYLVTIIPLIIGILLSFLSWRKRQKASLIFGHSLIILGCFLITWGVYLLPTLKPTLLDIFCRPLFWGLIVLMGGICEMCGHQVLVRQKAHIVAESKKYGPNLLMLCPSCHIMFDAHLKPKIFKALSQSGIINLPKSWETSIYEQAAKASKADRKEKKL